MVLGFLVRGGRFLEYDGDEFEMDVGVELGVVCDWIVEGIGSCHWLEW